IGMFFNPIISFAIDSSITLHLYITYISQPFPSSKPTLLSEASRCLPQPSAPVTPAIFSVSNRYTSANNHVLGHNAIDTFPSPPRLPYMMDLLACSCSATYSRCFSPAGLSPVSFGSG
ncbi:hypothetical protein C8R48DRAFT_732185, partial [Suillus tomentosus]